MMKDVRARVTRLMLPRPFWIRLRSLTALCEVVLLFSVAVVSASSGQEQPHAAPSGNGPASSSPSRADAERLISQGDLKQALTALDALAHQPTQPAGVEHLRGLALYQQSELGAAETAFRKALLQDPNDHESRQMLGVTLYRLGKSSQAIPILEAEHSSLSESSADPNYLLTLCYLNAQRYDDARRTIAAEYGTPPDSPSAYLLTARLLVRQEAMIPAQAALEKAIALNPRLLLAHELLGQIDLARNDTDTAIAEFQAERALNPLDAGLYEHLGDAYFRRADYEAARQALNRSLLLDPNSTGPYILLAKVLLQQQNYVVAAGYLERALRMDPENYIPHYLLGQAYHAMGRAQEASREFQASEKLRFGADRKPATLTTPLP